MPRLEKLPQQALDNMPTQAVIHVPETVLPATGAYYANGLAIMDGNISFNPGPGWYHFGTPENDIFTPHNGAPDYYIEDVAYGTVPLGDDTVADFEVGIFTDAPYRDQVFFTSAYGDNAMLFSTPWTTEGQPGSDGYREAQPLVWGDYYNPTAATPMGVLNVIYDFYLDDGYLAI